MPHKSMKKIGVATLVTPIFYPFEMVIAALKQLPCGVCPEGPVFLSYGTVSMRSTLVLPLAPLVSPPVMTMVSPFSRPRASLAARTA